jgi:hypothetical protein
VRRHRFDPFAFVFGAAFVFLAVFVLTGNSLGDLRGLWAVAIPSAVVALLIVLYAARQVFTHRPGSDERTGEAKVMAADEDQLTP